MPTYGEPPHQGYADPNKLRPTEVDITQFRELVEKNKEKVANFCKDTLARYFSEVELRVLYFEANYGDDLFAHITAADHCTQYIEDLVSYFSKKSDLMQLLAAITAQRPFLTKVLEQSVPDLANKTGALKMVNHKKWVDSRPLETFHLLRTFFSKSDLVNLITYANYTEQSKIGDALSLQKSVLSILIAYFVNPTPAINDEMKANTLRFYGIQPAFIAALQANLNEDKRYLMRSRISTKTRAPEVQQPEFHYTQEKWSNLTTALTDVLKPALNSSEFKTLISSYFNPTLEQKGFETVEISDLAPANDYDGLRMGGLCLWAMRHDCVGLLLNTTEEFLAQQPNNDYILNNFRHSATAIRRAFLT